MIPVMSDEIPYIPVMRQVALPGPGEQEFCAVALVLLQHEDFAALRGSMDRAEEPRGPGPDNHNIVRIHGYSPDQCL